MCNTCFFVACAGAHPDSANFQEVTGGTVFAFVKDKTGHKYSGREMEMPWHNRTGFGHNIRKYKVRSGSVSVVSA